MTKLQTPFEVYAQAYGMAAYWQANGLDWARAPHQREAHRECTWAARKGYLRDDAGRWVDPTWPR